MGDESGDDPRPAGDRPSRRAAGERPAAMSRAFAPRAPRCKVCVTVLCTPGSPAQAAAEGELVDVSSSGIFVACAGQWPVGTQVGFEFKLADVVALRGEAEVVRLGVGGAPGMGFRFTRLEADGQALIGRLVAAAALDPEVPTAPGYAGPAVEYEHGSVRVRLSVATAPFFTYSPLLHIGVGGCFLPADRDVAIGTGYQLDIIESVDGRDRLLLRCKAKVAAKQEGRIGLRLLDVDRAALQILRARIAARLAEADGEGVRRKSAGAEAGAAGSAEQPPEEPAGKK
jgi:hypothetical protein